ncbi:hypothetical protein BOO71_0004300 [Deinococcus marmoris]|uniref:Tyr recombinase domain-containing protein n=1 Tax=Deinococcus marmoris TaxID=249408 RepID=A0A1U7P1B1_9DEIO|nr:hypothetical protein BOO71_0004300 [Deinococcus marmoris]
MSASVHPHLFRHQMLTFLTGQKLSDAQIQLLSGYASKKSLKVYQHFSLDTVNAAYQQAVRFIDLWPPDFGGPLPKGPAHSAGPSQVLLLQSFLPP